MMQPWQDGPPDEGGRDGLPESGEPRAEPPEPVSAFYCVRCGGTQPHTHELPAARECPHCTETISAYAHWCWKCERPVLAPERPKATNG